MYEQPFPPNPQRAAPFPTGLRELIFGACVLFCALLLSNFTLYGGFNLGFAIGICLCILCSAAYLIASGCRPTAYSISLLAFSLLLAASFARSDDAFVKFVMVCFLLISVNLGLALLAGQNRHHPGTVASLLDAPVTLFCLGIGQLPQAFQGLGSAFQRSGKLGKTGGALLLGIILSVPVLLIMVPLLMRADAAFEGLIVRLPSFDLSEIFSTAFFGATAAGILYAQGSALRHAPRTVPSVSQTAKGLAPLTVNTVLSAVWALYLVYLFSQLAYFAGGLSGILPAEYTLAQYARRGFFEMAWLCAINLGIILLSLLLVRKKSCAPLSTRLLCLFIGLTTVFFVVTASAKMFLYIKSFGLTRLRVLTQVVMLFLALTTVLVMVRLFVPKFAYMKTVVLSALILCAAVSWTDVDTQVARYNTNAYLNGQMETVDVDYLNSLGDGAVPYIAILAEDAQDKIIAERAAFCLEARWIQRPEDFRSWNYVNSAAAKHLPQNNESYDSHCTLS